MATRKEKIDEARKEYEKIREPAWKEYEKIEEPAWKEYEKIEEPAWKEYEKIKETVTDDIDSEILKPEYIEKLEQIMKEKGIKFNNMEEFDEYFKELH